MSDSPAPEENSCQKVIDFVTKFMRPLNFLFGGMTIACGVYNLILSFGLDFGVVLRSAFGCVFTVILGLLLLAGEIPRLSAVKENCKFLIIYLGRGLFDIFIGGWIYSLQFLNDDKTSNLLTELLYYITFIGLFSLGGLFVFMHFCGKSKFIHSEPEAKAETKV